MLANRRGVFGVYAMPFLNANGALKVSAQRTAAGIAAPREDTISYVPELNTPRRMERLAHRLNQRRHPDRVTEKILGGNWLRLRDVATARG
jgi:microsomal dipeptidase-like Zn-dependent dipeptidase